MTASWRDLHDSALEQLGSPSEARWIVEEASGATWPWCATATAPARAAARCRAMVERRAVGEPLQYVLGRWSFRTLDLMVDRRVLIPRPETEQVVEVALGELDRFPSPALAVDLGTGSGAIALSLAAERPAVSVWATDSSRDALDVASANAAGLGGRSATRVRFAEGDWWEALPAELAGRVDLAVCNPPYVSSAEMDDLGAVVADWEPRGALEAGPTGLEHITEILRGARRWLSPAGAVVVELAPHQAAPARLVAAGAGFSSIDIRQDLAGRDRALVARGTR